VTNVMTSRRRSVAAMRGQPVDRQPCVPLIDTSYSAPVLGAPVSECFLHPQIHAESLAACLDKHPLIDGFSVNFTLSDEIILSREKTDSGWLVRSTGGMTWTVPFNDIGSVSACELVSFDDIRLSTDNPFKNGPLETIRALPPAIRRQYLVNCPCTGSFSQVEFLMGLDRVMLATIEDPAGLRRAIDRRVPLTMAWIDELAQLDPASIWIGEGAASSSLISPRAYQEFVLPYEKVMAEKIRQLGIPSVLHICGKIAPAALDLIATSGVDCLEADWPVNLAFARQRMGSRVALKGNLNTTTLVQTEPETIYALSRELMKTPGLEKGFILSSGCALGRDTPPANVDAMAQAALDG